MKNLSSSSTILPFRGARYLWNQHLRGFAPDARVEHKRVEHDTVGLNVQRARSITFVERSSIAKQIEQSCLKCVKFLLFLNFLSQEREN
jgi:hypothetical protein